jgi:predicted SAM-dependent methyltransferase
MFSSIKQLLRRPLRPRSKGVNEAAGRLWVEKELAWACRGSAREFAALRGRRGMKLNLGCGRDLRTGWVNVDLFQGAAPPIDPAKQPDTLLIRHDLRAGIPLEEGSCDLIYSSHFFEHLSFADGRKLMADCYRALRPGGVFRIVLPDFRKCFDAYLRNDADFFRLLDEHKLLDTFDPQHRTLIDYVNYYCYQFGEHVAMYDPEKLAKVLGAMGFRTVEPSTHQPDLDPGIDLRRHFSFYTSATK